MGRTFPDEQAFDRIALAISQAALDPSSWLTVVREFGRAFPGLRSQMIGWDLTHQNSLPQYQDGYPDEFVTSYVAHFQHDNPWIPGWSRVPVGRIITAEAVLSAADLARTEFYNDWILPQENISAGVGVVLFADASRYFLLGGNIPRKFQDAYEGQLMQLMARATPLMQQALEINRTLLGLRLDTFALRTGVDPADAAMLILGEGRTLIHANPLAQEELALGEVLRLSPRGRVAFSDPTAQSQLEQAMRGANGHGTLTFTAGNRVGGPAVRAVPLVGPALECLNLGAMALSQRPSILLILQYPSKLQASLDLQLRQAAGLTGSEAEIAVALHHGMTLGDIADARRVSIHTVRNQVKSALSKTGSRRQADLVRLVERLRQGGGSRG